MPEHILLGLMQEGGSLAARTLVEAGITRDDAARNVPKPPEDDPGQVRVGEDALAVFDEARAVMGRLGHIFTTPEHLLLALLSDPSKNVSAVLAHARRSSEEVIADVQAGVSTDKTKGDPRKAALGRVCDKCGASIEEHGKVKDLTLGIEDKPDAINLHAYFCGECGSAYGLVKE